MHRGSPDDAAADRDPDRDPGPDPGASPGSSSSTAAAGSCCRSATSSRASTRRSGAWPAATSTRARTSSRPRTASSRRRPAYDCRRAGCSCSGEFVVDHREAYGTWDVMQVFVAATDLTDADIDCREGRQIVFVDPTVARGPRPQLGGHRHRPGLPRQRRLRQHGAMTAQTLTVHPVPSMGAEDVLVAPDGTVFTGTEDGAIWALDPATGSTRRVADTGGRPLGIELCPTATSSSATRSGACCGSSPGDRRRRGARRRGRR